MEGVSFIHIASAPPAPLVHRPPTAGVSAALAALPAENLDVGVWKTIRQRGQRAVGLLDHCKNVIVGQDKALHTVCEAMWSGEVGLAVPSRRPRGVYLQFGPSGVGKTETAKQTAQYLFGGEPAILPLNEFGQPNTSGIFKEVLTGLIQGGTHCGRVLLFDELDKASRDTMDVLLSILDEGRMIRPDGQTYLDFTQYYIFLSSNIGADRLYRMSTESDAATIESMRNYVFDEAARVLRPEFFNRADRQLFYPPLSDETQRQIMARALRKKLDHVSASLLAGATIEIEPSAVSNLVGLGFHDQKGGARRVNFVVSEEVDRALMRADALPIPPKPPLVLRGQRAAAGGKELVVASKAAAFSAL